MHGSGGNAQGEEKGKEDKSHRQPGASEEQVRLSRRPGQWWSAFLLRRGHGPQELQREHKAQEMRRDGVRRGLPKQKRAESPIKST